MTYIPINFLLLFNVNIFSIGSCYIDQANLNFAILLPQPSEYPHYEHVPPHLAFSLSILIFYIFFKVWEILKHLQM